MLSSKRILTIFHIAFLEQRRNLAVALSALFVVVIFLIISFVTANLSLLSVEEQRLIIISQFLSGSLIISMISFGFSNVVLSTVEKKSNLTFLVLGQTQLKFLEYIIGTFLAAFVLFNLNVLLVFAGFQVLLLLPLLDIMFLLLFANISFLVLFALSFIFSSYINKVGVATSIASAVMLLLMFSLTFTVNFGSLLGQDVNFLLRFLLWNPLLFFYDMLLVVSGVKIQLAFGAWYNYVIIGLGISLIFSLVANKVFPSFESKK